MLLAKVDRPTKGKRVRVESNNKFHDRDHRKLFDLS